MKNPLSQLNPEEKPLPRLLFIGVGLVALIIIFVFQQFSYSGLLFERILGFELGKFSEFSLNKIIRFLLNDLAVILVIYGIFYQRKYINLALIVLCFGFLFLLLPYLFLVKNYPQYNGPLYSHLHRLIMNPILLLLLVPVLLYQKTTLR